MYGKIFQEIFHSTIADFNGDTIYTFMAMITLSDDDGYINYSVTALARTIRKDISIVEEAIKNLSSPDPESSTPDHDGRRIIPISELTNGSNNRGWWVVNKSKYKALASREDRKNQNRAAKQRQRKKDKSAYVSDGQQSSAMSAHTDTYIDTNTNKTNQEIVSKAPRPKAVKKQKKAHKIPDDFEPTLKTLEWFGNEGLSIDHVAEHHKFIDHWKANGKPFIDWQAVWRNWMRRADEYAKARAR